MEFIAGQQAQFAENFRRIERVQTTTTDGLLSLVNVVQQHDDRLATLETKMAKLTETQERTDANLGKLTKRLDGLTEHLDGINSFCRKTL